MARRLGLSRLRVGVAADEPVGAEVLDWYRSVGLALRADPFRTGGSAP